MSQGNWGSGGQGGGYGGPPAGGQPPGGYGPPPGGQPPGGYGPPPGGQPPGGYGSPPGGHGGPPGGYGGPPGYGPPPNGYGGSPGGGSNGGIGRVAVPALIGGAIGGILSSVPGLNILNCCFCALNLVGVGIGLGMFLRSNPNEKLNAGEAAAAGAISGAVAGALSSIMGIITNLILGPFLWRMYASLPIDMRQAMRQNVGSSIIGIPVSIVMFSAMGALGGFLAMQLFWKDRLTR